MIQIGQLFEEDFMKSVPFKEFLDIKCKCVLFFFVNLQQKLFF